VNLQKKVIRMDEVLNQGIGKELEIYTTRFTPAQEKVRDETWEVLVEDFFSKYVKPTDCVLDIGAGDGLFIKKIKARKRIAVDLSSHVNLLTKFGIEVHEIPATEMSDKLSEQPDVIFMSNFLEHLPDKKILMEVFSECFKVLRPGGKIMILQPNIRYAGVKYWDYVDHHIALTEFSLVEGLTVNGFKISKVIPQFLPYTAKSGLGTIGSILPTRLLIKAYLNLPILWKIFGAQTFVIAQKN
jgi:SAM-dependent methyltransferase